MRLYKGKSLTEVSYNFVVVDIETTGLSPEKDHIIEIGCVKYEMGIITDTFQQLVRPPEAKGKKYLFISPSIRSITGITDSMVEHQPTIDIVYPEFKRFVGTSIIVGHNVNFDINFLYDNSMRLSGDPLTNNFIDTMKLSRKYLPELDHHTLEDITKRLNVVNRRAHRALSDCYATGECYQKLCKLMEIYG